MRLNRIVLLLLLSVTHILAQDISTTNVKVVEGFKPAIAEATRLNGKATFLDTLKKDRTQEYIVIPVDLKSDYKTRPLKAAIVKPDKIDKLYQSRVSLGTGYRIGSKISAIYNSTRSKDMSYGLIFNHLNNNIKIDRKLAGQSNNNLYLYAKRINEEKIYIGNLSYDRIGVFTYGIGTKKEDSEGFKNSPYYNRFAYTRFSVSAINIDKSSDKIIRNTTFFVSDLNEFSENQIYLSSNLSKEINGFVYDLEIDFDNYLRYNNSGSKFQNTDRKIFSLSPTTNFKSFGLDFDIGFYFDMEDDFIIGFFPRIKATKELVKDFLLLYGGLSHVEKRHTFKSLSDENPYVHSSGTNQSVLGVSSFLQDIEDTDSQELYIGVWNVLDKGEALEASIAYGIVRNFAHFVGITNNIYNRFQVDYIDVKQLHSNLNYEREINNIISLDVDVDYYSWDKKVYHKPNFTFVARSPINLRDKIKVSPSLIYIGKRASISYFVSELGVPLDVPISEELRAQLHVNLDMYYSYSKQLSAYLQLNNLGDSKQDVWGGYSEVGFNCVLGLNYSF